MITLGRTGGCVWAASRTTAPRRVWRGCARRACCACGRVLVASVAPGRCACWTWSVCHRHHNHHRHHLLLLRPHHQLSDRAARLSAKRPRPPPPEMSRNPNFTTPKRSRRMSIALSSLVVLQGQQLEVSLFLPPLAPRIPQPPSLVCHVCLVCVASLLCPWCLSRLVRLVCLPSLLCP